MIKQLSIGDYWKLVKPFDESENFAELVNPDGFYRAVIKWDGCVHFYKFDNGTDLEDENWRDAECTYIHYCSLDEEIKTLMTLRNIQKTLFPDS